MRFLIILLGLVFTQCSIGRKPGYEAISSGINWFDQDNNEVNAHGACIIKEGDTYYLFGEYKTDSANVFIGFSCYSSKDLYNWTFEGMALPQQAAGILGPNRVGERPKVMKCPKTGEFVMFMHTDDRNYKDAKVGYATSKTINGTYTFRGPLLYEGKPIKRWDMGTFHDSDGKGYLLIHHGSIYELSDDFRSVKRLVVSGQKSGESPALFKSNGTYFWLSSNLTSWERNDNYYLTATSLEGPWTKQGCFAPEGSLTWNSQCSFVFPISNGSDSLFLYMGDRWSFPKQGSAATYVWQPISVEGSQMSVPEFLEHWTVNASDVRWQGFSYSGKPCTHTSSEGNWVNEAGFLVSNEKGATVQYVFEGSRIGLIGRSNAVGGYARFVLQDDSGKEILNTLVDFYSKKEDVALKFLSPGMKKGRYTLRIEVLGEHGVWTDKSKRIFGSSDDYIAVQSVFVE